MNDPVNEPADPPERSPTNPRARFVGSLYQLQKHIDDGGYLAHAARRDLARLRRSLGGPIQQMQAYEIVFRHEPPRAEQKIWLVVAGLFGVHPQSPPKRDNRDSLGVSLRALAAARGPGPNADPGATDSPDPTDRRFTQLLSVGADALPHYMRQCMQLLRAHGIPVNYYRLIDDLIALSGDAPQLRQQTRLLWARDYFRNRSKPRPDHTAPAETTRSDT